MTQRLLCSGGSLSGTSLKSMATGRVVFPEEKELLDENALPAGSGAGAGAADATGIGFGIAYGTLWGGGGGGGARAIGRGRRPGPGGVLLCGNIAIDAGGSAAMGGLAQGVV